MQVGVRPVASRWFDNSRWLFVAISVVGIGYVFVGAWLVTAGPPDPVVHTADFLKHLVSPWMFATYVVAGALISYSAWYLHFGSKRAVDLPDIRTAMKRQTVRLVIVWLIVAASLTTIGFLYTRDLENTSQSERALQQEAVARLKAQQIDKWVLERRIEAELLATSLRGLPLERLPSDRDAGQAVQLLFAEALAGNSERTAISLIAPDGRVLAHAGEAGAPDKETAKAALAFTVNTGQRLSVIDVQLDGTPPRPRMVLLVPITSRPRDGPMVAVLAMAVDPFQSLLPQIVAWPTPSPSSEAVVVRREGDEAVFLIPPSFLKPAPAPLEFRVPLAGSTLPAAAAVAQGDGVRIGRDYRGVEVLTASRLVRGIPWTVVATTDLEEINSPLRRKELTVIAVIGAALVLAALMMIVLWRGEYVGLLAIHSRQHEEEAALTLHFARLTQLARDAYLLMAPDGRILDANKAAVATYGYSAEELRRINIRDLELPEELENFDAKWHAAKSNDTFRFEAVHRRKDGTVLPVEVNTAAFDVDGKIYHQTFNRDVTERKALEREVAELLRERSALLAATIIPAEVKAGAIDGSGKIKR